MIKRVVDVSFWNDDKVIDLFTPEDKLFFLYLLTNPHSAQLGIYKINEKQMAFEIGYSIETISNLLDRFENKYFIIKYSKDTKEVAIKNFLTYAIIKGGKPVEDLLWKEIKSVKDLSLINYVFENIKNELFLNETVKKVISEYYEKIMVDNTTQNINGNGNDNYVSNNHSYNDSLKNVNQEQKKKFGRFNNVLLTDEQHLELKEINYEHMIDRMSNYLESKGKRYKNHYATLLNWIEKEKKENGTHKKNTQNSKFGSFI